VVAQSFERIHRPTSWHGRAAIAIQEGGTAQTLKLEWLGDFPTSSASDIGLSRNRADAQDHPPGRLGDFLSVICRIDTRGNRTTTARRDSAYGLRQIVRKVNDELRPDHDHFRRGLLKMAYVLQHASGACSPCQTQHL